MRKTFKYRLYPTKAQTEYLDGQLREACGLYNAALEERRDAWRRKRIAVNYYDQANQLKAIRAEGSLGLANFSCCQDVLRRVDKTFKAFFRRCKAGEKPGYPRFKSRRRFDSITFPSHGDGCRFLPKTKRLRIQGADNIKVKLHRPVEGAVKTITVKRSAGKWYVCFSVESAAKLLPPCEKTTAFDLGLENALTFDDGSVVQNPRWYAKGITKLRRCQRRVARRRTGGNGRRKAVRLLQKAAGHVRNQRNDHHHKVSRKIVNGNGTIFAEDLNVKGLAAGMLAKSVHDAGWTGLLEKIAYKAADAGRIFLKVNPRGTSQRCSQCGAIVPKTLAVRRHECPSCGLSVSRDHNSALEILRLGLSLMGVTWGISPCVPMEAVSFR